MKVSEAKQICKDFRPREIKGKTRCRHILAGDTCRLDSHFVCELVQHQEREKTRLTKLDIHRTMKKRRLQMISVSRVGTLQTCPRLYQLRYVYRLKSPIEAAWMRVGSAFGDERANIDQGLRWSLDKYELSRPERARIRAVLRRYSEFRRKEEDLVCETECRFEYRGVTFVGYVDSETFDGKRIYEWKYAVTQYGPLKVARQAAVYFKGKPNAEEFVVAVAKKPQHKPKKAAKQKKTPKATKKNPNPEPYPVPQAETMKEFEERVYDEIDEKWFTYKTYRRGNFDVETILDQMVAAWQNQEHLEALGYPPNFSPRLCDDCEYHGLCENHVNRAMGCDNEFCTTASMCSDVRAARNRLENPDMRKKLPETANG